MTNTVSTNWKGNMKFESDNPSGHTLIIDAGQDSGGEGAGLRPKALMLSALAGCSGLDVISILDKMKVKLDDYKMIIHGVLTEEHPKYYHEVNVEYHFYGSNLNENKIKKAVKLSDDKYCGVMEMFKKFAKININIIFHNN
ncbi:MAG: OsmC family protein [Flavobacteriaceae bacterium]|jgi:putative redox protein